MYPLKKIFSAKGLTPLLIVFILSAFCLLINEKSLFIGRTGKQRIQKAEKLLVKQLHGGSLTAKEAYQIALKQALNISSEAVLAGLNCKMVSLEGRNLNETLKLYGYKVKPSGWSVFFYTPEKISFKGFGGRTLHSFTLTLKDKGVSVSPAGAEHINSSKTLPSASEWKIDSPQALKIALKQGASKYIEQYPQVIIMIHLISNYSFKYMDNPLIKAVPPWTWEVNFGSSFSAAEEHYFIDAKTGGLLLVERKSLGGYG